MNATLYPPMEALQAKTLTRLRIGLAALMLGLIFDAVDLQVNDIDVLHDIAAAVLLGVAGWGLGQAAAAAGVARSCPAAAAATAGPAHLTAVRPR